MGSHGSCHFMPGPHCPWCLPSKVQHGQQPWEPGPNSARHGDSGRFLFPGHALPPTWPPFPGWSSLKLELHHQACGCAAARPLPAPQLPSCCCCLSWVADSFQLDPSCGFWPTAAACPSLNGERAAVKGRDSETRRCWLRYWLFPPLSA